VASCRERTRRGRIALQPLRRAKCDQGRRDWKALDARCPPSRCRRTSNVFCRRPRSAPRVRQCRHKLAAFFVVNNDRRRQRNRLREAFNESERRGSMMAPRPSVWLMRKQSVRRRIAGSQHGFRVSVHCTAISVSFCGCGSRIREGQGTAMKIL
jgi:hypothetical protein